MGGLDFLGGRANWGGVGRGGEKVVWDEALSGRGGGGERGRGALSFSILGVGRRGLREGGEDWRWCLKGR